MKKKVSTVKKKLVVNKKTHRKKVKETFKTNLLDRLFNAGIMLTYTDESTGEEVQIISGKQTKIN